MGNMKHMKRSHRIWMAVLMLSLLAPLAWTGCTGEDTAATSETSGTGDIAATATVSAPGPVEAAGIQLDPGLTSATGTPRPDEMPALIGLQAQVPYPVMVPTYLPGAGYRLEKELVGAKGPSANDPVGYYSYRYSDPANPNRTLTFNQTLSNSKPLSGYYLTEVDVDGTIYQVYWHKTLEYLPQGDPVRTEHVGDAETFVVVWKGQFTDAAGTPRDLYYSLSTGTWTGHGWEDIRALLASLRPLAEVGK